MLTGNVVALCSPLIFVPLLTIIFKPQNFDWQILKSIRRVDEEEEILEAEHVAVDHEKVHPVKSQVSVIASAVSYTHLDVYKRQKQVRDLRSPQPTSSHGIHRQLVLGQIQHLQRRSLYFHSNSHFRMVSLLLCRIIVVFFRFRQENLQPSQVLEKPGLLGNSPCHHSNPYNGVVNRTFLHFGVERLLVLVHEYWWIHWWLEGCSLAIPQVHLVYWLRYLLHPQVVALALGIQEVAQASS